MNNQQGKINYLAVVIIGLIAFALSLLWYSPLLFGDIWMKHRNATPQSAPQWTMFFAPLRELIVSYVMAMLITRLAISKWKDAVAMTFLLWVAFHAVGMAGAIIWDNMPLALGAVHAGDWLMKMLLMGIVLSLWHKNKFSSAVKVEQ